MPAYEFRCRTCADTFEVQRPMARAAEPAPCPQGHADTVRLLTTIGMVGGRGDTAPVPATVGAAGGGGCCGGACGCGG
jgi:putative FmdB family regulatory protein